MPAKANRSFPAALISLALAAALAAAPPNASAEVERYRYGYWQFLEGTSPDGTRMCIASTSGPSIQTDYRLYLGIKYYADIDVWAVHLANTSWWLQPGVRIQVQLQFDDAPPVLTSAATAVGGTDGQLVQVTVERERVADLLTQFGTASRGSVRFSGTEEPWTMRMTGAGGALTNMIECIKRARSGAEIPMPSYKRRPDGPGAKPPAEQPPSQPEAPPRPRPGDRESTEDSRDI